MRPLRRSCISGITSRPQVLQQGIKTRIFFGTRSTNKRMIAMIGYRAPGMAALLPGLGLFGTVLATRKRKAVTRKSILSMSLLGLLLLISMFALGCGSSSNNKPTTPASQVVNMTITGTSGSITQSSVVAITVN